MFAKFAILLFVLGAALANPADGPRTNLDRYLEKYHQKQRAEQMRQVFFDYCGLSEEDFDEALQKVGEQLERVDFDDETTVCDGVKDHLYNVFRPLIGVLDRNCNMQHKVGPLAKYVVKTVQEVVNQACISTGEEILELFNPCAQKASEENGMCVQSVLEDHRDKFNDIDELEQSTFTHELCSMFNEVIDDCVKPAVNSYCKLQKTKRSVIGFTTALVRNCPDHIPDN